MVGKGTEAEAAQTGGAGGHWGPLAGGEQRGEGGRLGANSAVDIT